MSFVIATPDLVESAAQSLAGIRSSLAEAAATAAGPTTGIATAAQDEVSVAISSMFGNFGQEFQALSAQAQAFHEQFVGVMNAGAGAYISAEVANAEQTLAGGVNAPAQSLLGGGVLGNLGQNLSGAVTAIQNGSAAALVSGEIQTGAQAISNAIAGAPAAAPTLAQGINAFGATVAAPYQALVSNTVTNLQAVNSTFMAHPFPFLNQVIVNQQGFAQTFFNGIAVDLQGFPANVPVNIQLAIQGASTFNPGALAQQFINGQIGTAQTITTSLQKAGNDLVTGLNALPASFQAAGQALMAGNIVGAGQAIGSGVANAFLPGFQDVIVPLAQLGQPGMIPIIPLGPLGDLAPIFAIPGQMAQSFTNLLPPGSILEQMAQNFTNVVNVVTDFGSTFNTANLGVNFGLPLQLVFDAIGAPGNALSALNSTGVALAGAVQTGNASAAAAAILDAPAVVANGFLNGHTLINLPPLTVNIGPDIIVLTSTAELPLGGLLTPLSPVIDSVLGPLPGTQIGGLIPGLLSFGPELAAAITPIT